MAERREARGWRSAPLRHQQPQPSSRGAAGRCAEGLRRPAPTPTQPAHAGEEKGLQAGTPFLRASAAAGREEGQRGRERTSGGRAASVARPARWPARPPLRRLLPPLPFPPGPPRAGAAAPRASSRRAWVHTLPAPARASVQQHHHQQQQQQQQQQQHPIAPTHATQRCRYPRAQDRPPARAAGAAHARLAPAFRRGCGACTSARGPLPQHLGDRPRPRCGSVGTTHALVRRARQGRATARAAAARAAEFSAHECKTAAMQGWARHLGGRHTVLDRRRRTRSHVSAQWWRSGGKECATGQLKGARRDDSAQHGRT
eukprot:scaffold1508_cov320-Prasinococcus_capsulatus_cf.AAC.3